MLRPPPEVPDPPILKALLVVIKKIKMQQLLVTQLEEQLPSPVMEPSVHPLNTQDELVDMSDHLWQKPSQSLPTWFLHLWDMGVENIIMSGSE